MANSCTQSAVVLANRVVHFDDIGMKLHDAVRDRDLVCMEKAMMMGAPVDFRDDHNNTPLQRAVHSGYVLGVKELLWYNADPDILDGYYSLSAKDLCQRNLRVQSEGIFYRRVPAADIMACYELLVKASAVDGLSVHGSVAELNLAMFAVSLAQEMDIE